MEANPHILPRIIERMRPVLDDPLDVTTAKRGKRGQARTSRPDREGTTYLAAHLPRQLATNIKILAAREGKTMHALIAEALRLLLAQRANNQTR
jgi:hypothetical protein